MNKKLNCLSVKSALVAASLALTVSSVAAVEPFKVQDIRVEGLQRVEPGTIFASLPVRIGDDYNDEKGAAAIRALFGLGLFKDVRLETNGDVLVVIIQERPSVAEVSFAGAREFDKDALKNIMRDIGITEGRPFDKALADRAEQELKRQYINRSIYGAEVVTTVTPVDRNRVNLTFTIKEGEPARIKQIQIVGNKAFSDSKLQSLFDQDTGGWLSWYTKSNRYSKAKLNSDLEALRSYYTQRGYLEFRIDSTQVAIDPDKKDISIAINITEGERFIVSGVRLEGEYLDRDDEFKKLIVVKSGDPYNAEQVANTVKAFSDYFGNFGFAFAKVDSVPEFDRANNRVVLVIKALPSRRAYVRRINVSGNNRTRDEVIRREFRQFEASWYDAEKIKLSRDRVDRLGYFTEVGVETQEVPGSPDQVDLAINVVEKPTGSIQLGAGFSSAEKVSLSFSVKQDNVFGSGNYLGVDVNTSKFKRTLVFSTTDPYFTEDGISRTLDVYYRTDKPFDDQGGNYELVTTGTSMRFGVPFSETDTVFFGGGLEQTKIKTGTNIPAAYLSYANAYGYSSTGVPLTIGWTRDDRDSALAPNSGRYQRLNSEWSVAGDARYVRGNYQFQQYIPLNKQFTVAFNGELGWGKGMNGRPFPVFKNFYSGGLGSVRGFEQGTLGPRDVTGASIGGPRKITLNAEFMAPFPGAGNDRTLRVFSFVDAGNVFGATEKVSFSDFRASVGLGLSWISPLGPLRLVYAQPVKKAAGDRIQKLQFQIGTSF